MLLFTQSCPTLCDPMDCSMPGFPVHHHLLELAESHVHWVGDAIWPSHPLLSPSPPAFHLFQHQSLFQWVSIRWPKYWSFSISPSSEYSGLISFRIDWFDLLAVQGTVKSLLQQHSSKASILWRSKNQDTVVVVVKEAQRSTRQNREPKYKSIQGQITDFWGRSKSSSMVEG